MAIIDQRILIPARQDVVWAYLSDLKNNAEWQADCRGVSFLSTKHTGAGSRWRSTTPQGRDVVLEITAWYNGLGYEYLYVDGGPFKENQGRLRLQEIPEGTVVQWTFSFEGGGLFGGGRLARQVDATMAASLKALYKQIKAFTKDQNEAMVAKSLMREAPDVEARAAYVPRHPSAMAESNTNEEPEGAVLLPVAAEPAVKAEDAGLIQAVDVSAEPPVAVDDTRPREPVEAVPEGDERFAPKPAPEAEVVPEPEAAAEAQPEAEPVTQTTVEPTPEPAEAPAEPTPAAETPAEPVIDRTEAAARAAAEAAVLPPPDTVGISIWERFGVPRPADVAANPGVSETPAEVPAQDTASEVSEPAAPEPSPEPREVAEVPVVTIEAPAAEGVVVEAPAPPVEHAAPVAAPTAQSQRRGLRVTERRALVRLRRPG
jgi:hypothetical protein